MRRVTLVSACLLLATMMSHAQTEQSVPMLESETSDTWFVELASSPTADGTAVATLEREEAEFHAAAASAGVRYTKRRHFRGLWNGLTVGASRARRMHGCVPCLECRRCTRWPRSISIRWRGSRAPSPI